MALSLTLLSVRAGAPTAALDASVDEYLRRCTRAMPATARTLRTEKALLDAIEEERRKGACLCWIADVEGTAMSSEKFAERIGRARDAGTRSLLLAIGPADGWSPEARAAADLRLSLGPMTLPHELARLVLAEQIYRATTILQGHPYHLGH